MPLQRTVISIPIGPSGVDTRTDPKAIPSPALAAAENVSFATPGRLTKRAGTDSLSLIGSGSPINGITTVGDALLGISPNGTTFRTAAATSWSATGQDIASIAVDYLYTTGPGTDWRAADTCRARDIDFLVLESSASTQVFARDSQGGVSLLGGTASATRPRCVTVGTTACFFWVSGANIVFSSSSSGFPAAGSLSTSNVVTNLNASALYDVAVSGSQILLFYHHTDGSFRHGYVSTSGVAGALTTETPAATPVAISCSVHSGGNYGLFWGMDATTTIRGRLFNSSAAALTAATTLDAAASGGIRNLVSCWVTSTNCSVAYELDAAADYNNLVRYSALNTSASVTTAATWYRHSGLASKLWLYSGQVYGILVHVSALQRAYVIAKSPIGNPDLQPTIDGTMFSGSAYGLSHRVGFVPSVPTISTGFFSVPLQTTVLSTDNRSVKLATMTFTGVNTHNFAKVGRETFMTGAQLWSLYPLTSGSAQPFANDEVGFHFYPENIALSSSNSTGSLTSLATYSYRFYWESLTADGRVEVSSYAGAQTITLGAADDTVQAVVHTLAHTNKANVWLGVYRSAAGPGSIHYRVSLRPSATTGMNGYLANSTTADTITFTDGLSDATLITKATDYQSSDPVELDNIAPPPARVIAAGNNRVALAGMEDDNLIWISKLRETSTEPLAFNDALTVAVDAGDGPITGMAFMQDNLVVFRGRQIYLVGGDGPDNVGLGGEFTPSRIISEDIGCTNQRSICRIPAGIMFMSSKGYYLLGNDLALNYIGAPVEAHNGDTVYSALALPGKHEVRILTNAAAGAGCLLYDYLAGQWAQWFTDMPGGGGLLSLTSACIWNGTWTIGSDGEVLTESTGFLDRNGDSNSSYTMAVETGWIHLSQLQSYQRLYRILFLGDYRAGSHKPRVRLAFDYNTTWVDDLDWDNVTSTAPYQFQIKPSRQKIQAVKIRIEDIASGGTLGDSFTLSEIALEIGVKPGLKPLAATSTLV